MKYFQEDAQLLEKLYGLERRSENTQDMMVPQNLKYFWSTWKKG
jgi:hypothetical protein